MKEFSQVLEFYQLTKRLDASDKTAIVDAYNATGDDGVQTVLEGFAASHADPEVRTLAQAALDARAAD